MSMGTSVSDTSMADADTSKATDEDKELALGMSTSIGAFSVTSGCVIICVALLLSSPMHST